MSGYPRWMRQDRDTEIKVKEVSGIWSRLPKHPPKTSPSSSLPKALSAKQGAHAEQRVSHPCSSDREMPVSGSVHGCVAFVERSRPVPRRKVPNGNAARGDA